MCVRGLRTTGQNVPCELEDERLLYFLTPIELFERFVGTGQVGDAVPVPCKEDSADSV